MMKRERGGMNYTQLVKAIDLASQAWPGRAASVVNQTLVVRNWLVGAYIAEFGQHGKDRARYGARLLETLSRDLAARGIRGLSSTNLKHCRQLYHVYPQIRQTVSGELALTVAAAPLDSVPAAAISPLSLGSPSTYTSSA